MPAPDDSVSPLPTPAPTRSLTMVVYQGLSIYNDLFEVVYDSKLWQETESCGSYQLPGLVHTELPSCVFCLQSGGIERSGPIKVDEIVLGHYRWQRLFYPKTNFTGYYLYIDGSGYSFETAIEEEASDDEILRCRADAEAVIATLVPLPDGPTSPLSTP